MSATAKKFRSKWTRIATEGATTDGRKIERSWIEQMAAQYNTSTYGARINCEHIKSSFPGSEFGAYGDVVALKAEEVELNGEKKLGLFAQLQPNDALIALNKKGQKIYTSIEVQPEFADTGKAYLVGLAVTDTPASLGTEALSFSAQHGTLASRKQHADNLFTAAAETALDFEEVDDAEGKALGLFNRVMSALGKSKDKAVKDDAQFSELTDAVEALADHAQQQGKDFAAQANAHKELSAKHDKLAGKFADLLKRLENSPEQEHSQRPHMTGGDGKQDLAEF